MQPRSLNDLPELVRYNQRESVLQYYVHCNAKAEPEPGYVRVNSVNVVQGVTVKVYADVPASLFRRRWDPEKHFEGTKFGANLMSAKPLASLLENSALQSRL